MDIAKLSARERSEKGTGAARRLRREGKIPAVLYGDGDATPLALDSREFRQVDHGGTGLLTLEVDGSEPTTALVKEIQRDPVRDIVVHVDLMKVSMTDSIHSSVPVNLVGEPPGVKMGGVLQHALWELELQALAKDMPASIDVDLSELDLGGSIHAGGIKLPAGVGLLTSPDSIVATILAPTIHVEEVPEEELAEEELAAEEEGVAEEGAPAEEAAETEGEG